MACDFDVVRVTSVNIRYEHLLQHSSLSASALATLCSFQLLTIQNMFYFATCTHQASSNLGMLRILPFRSVCHDVAFGFSSASAAAYRAHRSQKLGPRQCRASCRFDLSVTCWPFHLVCHMLQYCNAWCRLFDTFFCFDLFVSNCPPQAESKSFETESSFVSSAMFYMLHPPQFHAAV